jgi:hypothetical protein
MKLNPMKFQTLTLLSALFGGLMSLTAQTPFTWTPSAGPSVSIDGLVLDHPFAGGLTAPQWSSIDFDFDGDDDLFAFDRDGERVLLFERLPDGRFVERLDWEMGWPELEHWVLLRDYDCDGQPDLFTGYQNSVHVYHNVMTPATAGTPAFELVAQPLMASWNFGSGDEELSVLCLTIDKPAIGDFNGDGALDIVTFTETSSTLYAFTGLTACGLDFECTNRCFGMWNEGFEDNSVFIGADHSCSFNVVDPRAARPSEGGGYRHAGGTVTLLQLDDETPLPDLLVGDVSYPTLVALLLEDAVDGQDSTVFADPYFPSLLPHSGSEDTLKVPRFPAAYPVDYDADGVTDLVVSPNTHIETDDDAAVHVWRNAGTETAPVWEWMTDRFIQEGMLDVGRGAAPVWVDLDGDGLLDLALANKERYEGVGMTPTQLTLFKNTGTAQAAAFELWTESAIDFAANGIESAYPAFGDLDGDGDLDAVVGDELGVLHTYVNVAGPGVWPVFELDALALLDADGELIDVGQFAAPQLVDVQGDGALDLVVGHKNGTLKLFSGCENGWCPQGDWAGIQVDNQLGINGYSVPCLYEDAAGLHVFVANETGRVQDFGVVDAANWAAELTEVDDAVGGFVPGLRAAASLGDLNGDGLPELAIGIQNGGVRLYASGPMSVDEADRAPQGVALYPNPSSAERPSAMRALHGQGQSGTVEVWTLLGELVHRANLVEGWTEWTLPSATPGAYLVRFTPTKTGAATAAPVSFRWFVQG